MAGPKKLGRYELLSEIGAGGMGVVHLARQTATRGIQRPVVVKRVHTGFGSAATHAQGLVEEARLGMLVRHANVVPIIDVVEEDGEVALVMEYVEAVSVATLLRCHGGRLPPPIATRILADGLAGLHAAHETKDLDGKRLELVHRDVSPHNFLVGTDGVSRLIDFGIAKATEGAEVTRSEVKGKLHYMAPEQLQGQRLDRRADVFAAGIVLYEMLTGHRPFEGDNHADVMMSVLLHSELDPPSAVAPDVPPALDAVVLRAAARVKSERFASAAEFLEALEAAVVPAPAREVTRFVEAHADAPLAELRAAFARFTQASTTSATFSHEAYAATAAIAEGGADAPSSIRRRSQGKRAVALALILVVVIGSAVIATLRLRRGSGEIQAPSTASPLAAPSSSLAPSAVTSAPASAPPAASATPSATTLPRSTSPPPRVQRPRGHETAPEPSVAPPSAASSSPPATSLHANPYGGQR